MSVLDILLWIGVKELFYCSENVVHKLQKKLTNDKYVKL